MAQGYYTLEEGAQILGISPDELKMIARRGEIRSFQDRGTWRFRVQDIQELARQRGLGSEPELTLGESAKPVPKSQAPKSAVGERDPTKKGDPKSGTPEAQPEVFDFSLGLDEDEATDVGRERPLAKGSKLSDSKKQLGPKSAVGPATPPPGSDSDVRLVSEQGDFGIDIESGTRLGGEKKSRVSKAKPSDSDKKKLAPAEPVAPDSGVRLVPPDSDSDVRLDSGETVPLAPDKPMSASDSDVRLEQGSAPPAAEPGSLTEEIDLDAELRKQEERKKSKARPSKVRPPQPAAPSPFDLTDEDLKLPSTGSTVQPDEGSSDFDLTPAGESTSPLDLGSDEFEFTLDEGSSSDVEYHDSKATQLASASGINLDKPTDKGIPLEQDVEGSDEINFNLSADKHATPAPSSLDESGSGEFELAMDADSSSGEVSALGDDSSSEFELSLDAESGTGSMAESASSEFELSLEAEAESSSATESSSEFELTIDPAAQAAAPDLSSDSSFDLQLEPGGIESSSSEFELTIDDDVGLADESGKAAVIEDSAEILEVEEVGSQETELLEVPIVEDESMSQVVALEDTDLETSDFDIDLESSSQVVTLDEEEVVVEEVGEKAGLDVYPEEEPVYTVEEEEEIEPVIIEKQAAPWGVTPVLVMLPCTIIMLLVALMSFEMATTMSAGYSEPGPITRAISNLIRF